MHTERRTIGRLNGSATRNSRAIVTESGCRQWTIEEKRRGGWCVCHGVCGATLQRVTVTGGARVPLDHSNIKDSETHGPPRRKKGGGGSSKCNRPLTRHAETWRISDSWRAQASYRGGASSRISLPVFAAISRGDPGLVNPDPPNNAYLTGRSLQVK